eukprot:6023093-Amphidinium_carterae.1
MRAIHILVVDANRFVGALPDGGCRDLTKLEWFSVASNYFEGQLKQTQSRSWPGIVRMHDPVQRFTRHFKLSKSMAKTHPMSHLSLHGAMSHSRSLL